MPSGPKRAYERESALAHLGGDEELLAGLIELLRQNGRGMCSAVNEALARDDLREAALAAHKLAGAVANLHAWPTRDAALEVERAAEVGDVAAAKQAYLQLGAEFDRLLLSVTPPDPEAGAAEESP